MRVLFVLFVALIATTAFAVEPDEMLPDPVLEERARVISKQLRCVVCQNQDIDSSNAGVARDLRILVRERLVAGDSDQDVIDFIHARYGDYVLMRPPFNRSTIILWAAPLMLTVLGFAAGGSVLIASRRRRRRDDLTAAEEAEVDRVLKRVGVEEKS
jgi:cytochrome c-type biogenesis protein CcmH